MTTSEKNPTESTLEEAKDVMRQIAFALGNNPTGTKAFQVAPPILKHALDAAERRGFERAKRMAVEALPDFKIHVQEYANTIDNLKFEEG